MADNRPPSRIWRRPWAPVYEEKDHPSTYLEHGDQWDEYVHVPEGHTVVVLSDFDMKIVLPGLIAQLERKIPKPRSERSSWASIASIGVLPFLRRLANEGTDD